MACIFGMPTLIEFKSLEENFELCNELGLDFIELNMNLPYCLPEKNEINKILQLKKKYNAELTMHFPEEIDFGTFYKEVRQANIDLFTYYAEWSAKIGIRKINVHLNQGVHFSMPDGKEYIYKNYNSEFISNLEDSFEKLSCISNKNGIELCVENTVIPDFFYEAFFRLSKIKNVYFTWDIGHDAATGFKAKEIYSNFKEKLRHMHFHDFDGKKDHKTLFEGNLDLMSRLKFAYEKDLSVVIEVKRAKELINSVKRLNEVKELLT